MSWIRSTAMINLMYDMSYISLHSGWYIIMIYVHHALCVMWIFSYRDLLDNYNMQEMSLLIDKYVCAVFILKYVIALFWIWKLCISNASVWFIVKNIWNYFAICNWFDNRKNLNLDCNIQNKIKNTLLTAHVNKITWKSKGALI